MYFKWYGHEWKNKKGFINFLLLDFKWEQKQKFEISKIVDKVYCVINHFYFRSWKTRKNVFVKVNFEVKDNDNRIYLGKMIYVFKIPRPWMKE